MRPKPKTAPPQAAGVWSAKHFVLALAALCALGLIAYANSLSNGFVWDDHQQLVMNPALRPGAPLLPLLTTDARFANHDPAHQTTVYRPLQMLTYRAVLDLFGADATAFHLLSVAFALVSALAAFWLFSLLTRRPPLAFAAAAVFVVHPIHTEAIDWIAALPDLGCGLFVLLAFALFLSRRTMLSLAAFALALLWKETALVVPVLLAAYVLLQPAANRLRESLRASAPYWLLVALYLGVRIAVLGALNNSPRTWLLTPAQSLLSAAHLLALYWLKLALPLGLNAYHVFHPVRSLPDARSLLAILCLLALLAACFFLRRRAPLAIFAIAWVLLTLLPALNLNALGRNAFAERYLYLPSAGFCLLLVLAAAWLLGRLPVRARKPAAVVVLVVLLAAFTAETIDRNPDWKDDATLFAATLPLAPDSPFVHVMVASDDPSNVSSEQNFRQAIDLATHETPLDQLDAVSAYQGLASLEAARGQFDRALAELAQARALAPNNPNADGQEGILLAQAGRGPEAVPLLERAHQQQPQNVNVLTALGLIARDDLHDLPRAAALFTQVLTIHGEADDFAASTHNNLAAVYGDQGNYPAAVEQLRQAIAISPGDPEFHINLASSLAASERFPEARQQAQIALQLAPGDPAAQDLFTRLQSAKP